MSLSTWQSYVDFMVERGNIDEIMIVSSDNGALWASSDLDNFYLREYNATIMQEDGTEKEEKVNEADNIVKMMKGQSCNQGLRVNGKKKQQITRRFNDDDTGLPVIITKVPMGGSCIANAGKCIIIGTFNETKGHTSPPCNETVTAMAAYLKKSNWPDRTELVASSGSDAGGSGSSGGSGVQGGEATWQVYVDLLLIGKGNVADGMLLEVSNGKVLAASKGWGLQVYDAEIPQEDGTDKNETVNEAKNILQLMKGSKPAQGLRVNKQKYQIIRSFKDETTSCYTVLGKKAMGGIAIVHSGKVIVMGTFDEKQGHSSPGCNETISNVAAHLKAQLK